MDRVNWTSVLALGVSLGGAGGYWSGLTNLSSALVALLLGVVLAILSHHVE